MITRIRQCPELQVRRIKQKFMPTRQRLSKENCLVFMCFSAISRVFCLLCSEWEKSIKMQRSINSFFQGKRKVVALITCFQLFSIIEPKFNLVLALLVFSEATLSFISSSRDGGVSEKATEDSRKEVVEAKTGQVAAPLSAGSCSCERRLRALHRLKTWCRSSMGSNRLNGLALAYVHSEIPVDPLEPLQRWRASGQRRIALAFNI